MRVREEFASALGPTIARYLALKEALGRKYAVERVILTHLDAFLASARTNLTSASFERWLRTRQHLSSSVRRNWMRVVRNLCLYRRRTTPACFVPDRCEFPPLHQPIQPHIFTEAEVARLLAAADRLPRGNQSPLRAENFRLAIVLLYTTGLRRGELLRLTIGDYDFTERALLVRESKFHKSRLLPLASDGSPEVTKFLQVRRSRHLPSGPDEPLLWNCSRGGRTYTGTGLRHTICDLLTATGIRTATGRLPRVHDFRHSFAVNALLRWYKAGLDVRARLPFLAAYMGHVSIASTEYYLHFVENVGAAASALFARHCGALVTRTTRLRGGDS